MKTTLRGVSVLALMLTSGAASAQFTLSTGAEYTSGKYGDPDKTTSWTIPLIAKYETGPWTFKLNLPWTRVTGTANRETGLTLSDQVRGNGTSECFSGGSGELDDDAPPGCASSGGSVTTRTKRSQQGLGDLVGSVFYTVLDPSSAPIGLDVGGKIKFATARKKDCLLTTGENDYSIQADLYKTVGAWSPYVTLGWTKKGDPEVRDAECNTIGGKTDYKNPWYAGIGASYKLSDVVSLGASYDFRAKLLSSSDPISEATAFVNFKLDKNVKLQVYGLTGFSDNSPDWGLGATIGYTF